MDEALCAGPNIADRDIWFADGTGSTQTQLQKIALSICDDCPVKQECFDYANRIEVSDGRTTHAYGIYGGVPAGQRMSMRRARLKRAS